MSKQARVDIDINNEQAKARLEEIKTDLRQIKQLRDKAAAEGDVKGFTQLDKEMKKLTRESQKLDKNIKAIDNVLNNLSGASIKELEQAYRAANLQAKNMSRTDPGWAKQQLQVKRLKTELDSATGSAMVNSNRMQGLSNNFKKYLIGITSFIATVTGLAMLLRRLIRVTTDFEKSLSSLSAITGLTGNELDNVKRKAMEMSGQTLKSSKEIVEAFERVGSVRPELLKDAEALAEVTRQAIILSEATGGKLSLEDAAKAVAGALNQFSEESDQASRAANVLAAGSKFGAAGVVELNEGLKVFGAVASNANLTLETSVGLMETLAEKQIVGAEAGTKLRNMLIVLQGDQRNYRDGIFDVNLALENLANQNLNVTEMTSLFGRQNVVAAQILTASREKVIKYTEAVTGTNTALEQQAIQNSNVAGMLTKLGNSWENLIIKINTSNGKLYENLRFIDAVINSIGRSSEKKEKVEIFDTSGVLKEAELAKMTVDELDKLLEDINKNKQLYFDNWQKKSGEERAFWAGHFDIAKENIEKIELLINAAQVKELATAKENNEEIIEINKDALKKNLQAELMSLESRLAIMQDGYDKELAVMQHSFDVRRQAITDQLATDENLTTEARAHLNEVLLNMDEERFMAENELTYKHEKQQLKERQDHAEQLLNDRLIAIDRTEIEENKALTEAFHEKFNLLNQQRAAGKITEQQYQDELLLLQNEFSRKSLEIAIQKAEAELAILRASGEDTLAIEAMLADMRLEMSKSIATQETADKEKVKITWKDIGIAAIDAAQTVADGVAEIKRNARQAELDAQLAAINRARDAELANENLTEEQREKIKEKFLQREAAIKLKHWRAEQKAAISMALINGALAITKIFATYQWPAGIIPAAAQAIATGMQVAVIKSQKPPQFKGGGYTDDDLDDGKPVGVVHANEFVANAQAKRNPSVKRVLDIIDYAQRAGTIRTINLPAQLMNQASVQMRSGGYAPQSAGAASAEPATSSASSGIDPALVAMDRFADAVEKLQRDGIKGKWVYQDFQDMAAKENNAINQTS